LSSATGGTLNQFTGDGIMAVFGAPISLEDHAFRACLSAVGVQREAEHLAAEVQSHDGVTLQLRIGLNSGQVIAGEIGSRAAGYTAIGEQVGMAQRMESAAPPGGVMLSESTARLVEDTVALDDAEVVEIKGVDTPVKARRLRAIGEHHPRPRRESRLVGRTRELNFLTAVLDEAVGGAGCAVNIVGPAGIGKSRLVREVTAIAARRHVAVCTAYCESHASDVSFQVISRILRAGLGIDDLAADAARVRVREQFADSDDEDLILFDDLLGIGDAAVSLPAIAPEARRRRLSALINSAALAQPEPAVYVVEDVHWIDEVSESMMAEFLAVIPQTPSLMLITSRPEYRGALIHASGAEVIALRPLSHAHASTLAADLLGDDPSLADLTAHVSSRAAGNPFFAEEIVRDLAERGVLNGAPGAYAYTSRGDIGDVDVPATLQATIGARIDRLGAAAKHTLNAAAVIGSRFSAELLASVVDSVDVASLIQSELVDQIRFGRRAEYAFRNPLIRAVAYESQLKSDRAQLHRRLAAAIEGRDPASADENAALIAEHLEAAGDSHQAFEWHMRAGAWLTNRDILAARNSWRRALLVADRLPDGDPDRMSLRIAARAPLCATAFRVGGGGAEIGFDELRDLCTAAGDKRSLVLGLNGLATLLLFNARRQEASRLADELVAFPIR
jgi:adenylate cyclase